MEHLTNIKDIVVTGVRHRVTFWAVCYKTHFISCPAPICFVPLQLETFFDLF